MTHQDIKIIANEEGTIPSDDDIMREYMLSIKEGDTASNNS